MVFTFFDDFGLRKNLRKKNCSPSKQPDRRRCIMVVDACDTGRSRVGPSAAAAVKSEIIFGRPSSRRFHLGFRDLYNRDLRGKQWMHSAACRYSARIWEARICLGLAYSGQISRRLHFAVQSLRSVTQPAQIFEALISGDVHFIELKLVCAEVGTPPPILQTPWSTRPATYLN